MNAPSPLIKIGGLTPLTTVDYPGRLSAVIFCQGCPWRCRYCHNAHLQSLRSAPATRWTWERLRAFLAERQDFLEAVTFSGGEPTMQRGLPDAMREVRDMGFGIGLHTAGMFPDRLAAILPLVDWVGLDIKAPFDQRYDRITGRKASGANVSRSLDLLLASGIDYTLRTTLHPALLNEHDCADLQAELDRRHATPTTWQEFRPQGCRDPELLALA